MTGQGIDTRVIAPAELPGSAVDLAVYDALILSDTPAKALAHEKMLAIESYVRDFGGEPAVRERRKCPW